MKRRIHLRLGRHLLRNNLVARMRVWVTLAMVSAAASCSAARQPAPPDGARPQPSTTRVPAAPAVVPAPPTTARTRVPALTDGGAGGAAAGESLQAEEGERDPGSQEVTIRLQVEPPKLAHVYWGAKDLGLAPLEIRRPRGSGPLDLVLRAPGYLTYHTRLFTDRDDRLSIRMVPVTNASGVFGYRAPPEKSPVEQSSPSLTR